jgi:hypothetical protein
MAEYTAEHYLADSIHSSCLMYEKINIYIHMGFPENTKTTNPYNPVIVKLSDGDIYVKKNLFTLDSMMGRDGLFHAVLWACLKSHDITHEDKWYENDIAIDNEIKYTEEYIEGAKTKLQELRALKDGNETEKTLR